MSNNNKTKTTLRWFWKMRERWNVVQTWFWKNISAAQSASTIPLLKKYYEK